MNEIEMRNAIKAVCDNAACENCVYADATDPWCDKYNSLNIPANQLRDIMNKLCPSDSEDETLDEKLDEEQADELIVMNDVVNHPSHYCREGAMESIDEMVLVFGKEAVKYFCLCNVWKYRTRAMYKNGEEDLKKSDWYMKKYKELCSNE